MVEVFDMGTLSDQYAKVTTITQKAFQRQLQGYLGLVHGKIQDQKEYKITSIHPIYPCESLETQLLLTT